VCHGKLRLLSAAGDEDVCLPPTGQQGLSFLQRLESQALQAEMMCQKLETLP